MCDSLYIDFLGFNHCVRYDTVRVVLDSVFDIHVLEKSQEFYTNSFNNLISLFAIFVTIVLGFKIYERVVFGYRIKNIAKKESLAVKTEIEREMKDFESYVGIAFAITKFRDSKPTKEDLKILLKTNIDEFSERTIHALIYALRKSLDALENDDVDLANELDSFVRPIAKKLNSCENYNIYGAIANQILMRTEIILTQKK